MEVDVVIGYLDNGNGWTNSRGLMGNSSRAKDCSHPSFFEHDDVPFAAGIPETNRSAVTCSFASRIVFSKK